MNSKQFFFILCLLPLGLLAQQQFTIEGKVGELNAPNKVFLYYHDRSGKISCKSASLSNGAFSLSGQVNEPIAGALVVVNTKLEKFVDNIPACFYDDSYLEKGPAHIYLEQGKLKVNTPDSLSRATLSGSKLTADYNRLLAVLEPSEKIKRVLSKKQKREILEKTGDSDIRAEIERQMGQLENEQQLIYRKFALENPDSYVGLVAFEMTTDYDMDPTVIEPEFLRFDAKLRQTGLGKKVAYQIEVSKNRTIGSITDFTQPGQDGKPVKLSDFRGKYVFVDFWASWCGPCRAENPNVLAMYNKYRDKNFTVLGVSLDEDKTKWLKAVKKDGLPWTQVYGLGQDHKVPSMYGITAIPFTLLFDPQGRLVAKGLRGEELANKLKEILENTPSSSMEPTAF